MILGIVLFIYLFILLSRAGCVRLHRFVWFWEVRRELGYQRVTHRGRVASGTNPAYENNNDSDNDDKDDIFLNANNG